MPRTSGLCGFVAGPDFCEYGSLNAEVETKWVEFRQGKWEHGPGYHWTFLREHKFRELGYLSSNVHPKGSRRGKDDKRTHVTSFTAHVYSMDALFVQGSMPGPLRRIKGLGLRIISHVESRVAALNPYQRAAAEFHVPEAADYREARPEDVQDVWRELGAHGIDECELGRLMLSDVPAFVQHARLIIVRTVD